jgi:hypothetical protein
MIARNLTEALQELPFIAFPATTWLVTCLGRVP